MDRAQNAFLAVFLAEMANPAEGRGSLAGVVGSEEAGCVQTGTSTVCEAAA